MTDLTFNELAVLARGGDIHALEQLLRGCQQRILPLCRRMLRNASDAQDAAQEVLIKIATSLGNFRGDSDFMTWAHRIAVNHLLSLERARKSESERFDALGKTLQAGMQFGAGHAAPAADEPLLAYEVFVECAQRMLQCLDGPNRLALVLVDICDLSNEEAAAVLEIGADAFRQRLSRARRELTDFLDNRCSLINPAAPCHCAKQVPAALAFGTIAKQSATTGGALSIDSVTERLRDLHGLARTVRMLRQLPAPQTPDLVAEVRRLLNSEPYRPLH